MLPLADTQAAIAKAMITGDARSAPTSLAGGPDPGSRFAIHLRHYQTSLRAALEDKFPATVWLLGASLFRAAASSYVREQPPRSPCIAEYASDFPQYIAGYGSAASLGYIEAFAQLEWLLGRASIAVEQPALSWLDLIAPGPDRLLGASFGLQAGVAYLRAEYAVDELLKLYLHDREPESFDLPAADTRMEISGSRGRFRIDRPAPAHFEFRFALQEGEVLSEAASRALTIDEQFDPGQALRELIAAGRITSVNHQ